MKNHVLASFTALLSIPLLLTAQAQAADISASSFAPAVNFDDTSSSFVGDEFSLLCQGGAGGADTSNFCYFFDNENAQTMFRYESTPSAIEMGIGTSTPSAALHIATPQVPYILLDSASTDFRIGGSSDVTFRFVTNLAAGSVTGNIITLENTLNLPSSYPGMGIWDSDPTVPLEVGSHDNQSAAVKV